MNPTDNNLVVMAMIGNSANMESIKYLMKMVYHYEVYTFKIKYPLPQCQ